jgi:hypothetical protein
MVSSATDSSKRKLAAMAREVEAEGSPWIDSDALARWQEGTEGEREPAG